MAANIGGYISIGTNNLEAAREFYDKLFEPIGVKGFRGNESSYFYKFVKTDTYFAIFVPFDGKEATVGNGSMTGITFDSIEEVNQIYQIAIESGALSIKSCKTLSKKRIISSIIPGTFFHSS